MPYTMIKVLTILKLTTLLVLNNWALKNSEYLPYDVGPAHPCFHYILWGNLGVHITQTSYTSAYEVWKGMGYTVLRSMISSLLLQFCSVPCTVSRERTEGIKPNFAYALTLTRSRLELLCTNYCKFTIPL